MGRCIEISDSMDSMLDMGEYRWQDIKEKRRWENIEFRD